MKKITAICLMIQTALTIQKSKKSAQEMVQHYSNFITKHSEDISYLEDPIHKQDSDCWIDLTQSLQTQNANTSGNANAVKVIGNLLHQSVPEQVQPAISNKWSNGMVISTQAMATVSQALRIARAINESEDNTHHNFELIVDDGFLDSSCSSYAIDLAVACRAKLVAIPPVGCGQGIEKYNRWLSICEELNAGSVTEPVKNEKNNAPRENEKEELP